MNPVSLILIFIALAGLFFMALRLGITFAGLLLLALVGGWLLYASSWDAKDGKRREFNRPPDDPPPVKHDQPDSNDDPPENPSGPFG